MKKLAILFTVFVAAATLFISCETSETPGSITKEVYNKMASGDYDYVIDKIDTQGENISSDDRENLKKMFEMSAGQLEKKGGVESVRIVEETISEDGKSCQVKAEVKYGNGDTEPAGSNFVKVDGEWKISISQ